MKLYNGKVMITVVIRYDERAKRRSRV